MRKLGRRIELFEMFGRGKEWEDFCKGIGARVRKECKSFWERSRRKT